MTPAPNPPLTPLQLSTVENPIFFISQTYFKDTWKLSFISYFSLTPETF